MNSKDQGNNDVSDEAISRGEVQEDTNCVGGIYSEDSQTLNTIRMDEAIDEPLDVFVHKMRSLKLFEGVHDPYAELMRERGIEVIR